MTLFLALLLPAQGQETVESLVERWKADDVTVRERAFDEVLSRWKEWKDRDVAVLERAARDRDPEVGSRAADAVERVKLRKTLGAELLKEVPGVDAALLRGTSEERVAALNTISNHWGKGAVRDADMAAIARRCVETGWKLDPEKVFKLLDAPESKHCAALYLPFLDHEDKEVKLQALACLGILGRPAHGVFILPLLGDREPGVRQKALAVLSALRGAPAERIVPLLKDGEASVRKSAVEAMEVLGRGRGKDLLPLLKDPETEIRREAADALIILNATEVADDLLALLKDEDGGARRSAARILGAVGAARHASGLRDVLQDPDYRVRRSALSSLADLGGETFAPDIAALLRDPDPTVQIEAAAALADLRAESFGPALVPLLKAGYSDLRAQACESLARIGARKNIGDILPLLRDDVSGVQIAAVRSLIALDAREQAASLRPLLKDPDRNVRYAGLEAAGALGDASFIADLLPFLRQSDDFSRARGALAIARLSLNLKDPGKRDEVGPELAPLRGDDSWRVRIAGRYALLSFAEMDKSLVADVIGAINENGADPWPFLNDAVLDGFLRRFEPDGVRKLDGPLPVRKVIDSMAELKSFLDSAGLELVRADDLRLAGRWNPGGPLTPRRALEKVVSPNQGPLYVVLDGSKVHVLGSCAALEIWRKRLSK